MQLRNDEVENEVQDGSATHRYIRMVIWDKIV